MGTPVLEAAAFNRLSAVSSSRPRDVAGAVGLLALLVATNRAPRNASITSSELFRMVTVLSRRGYIEQQEGDRYSLTLKLFELAHRHKPIK